MGSHCCIVLGAVVVALSCGSPDASAGIFGLCGAILPAQARRAAKYFWEAGDTRVSVEVKYEN